MKKELFIVTEDVPGVSVLTKCILKKGDIYLLDPEKAKHVKTLRKASLSEVKAYQAKWSGEDTVTPVGDITPEVTGKEEEVE